MDMTEIYEIQARQRMQMAESAALEAQCKAINDITQAFFMFYNAQITALAYAGLNPNFCKPGG